MKRSSGLSVVIVILVAASGCASHKTASTPTSAAVGVASGCDPVRDHDAILMMSGTFDVDFEFEETRALAEGYELHETHQSGGSEVVIVLEESPSAISLQHVLLIAREGGPALPMKHWRQDWVFEDTSLLEFRGNRVWEHRTLSADEARCTWSQAVYQVDDGPRYESFGRFTYRTDGRAVWTSEETWRPLPRREYTKRDDYDVLIATNRHVIGKDGWTHEQDNQKWVLAEQHALVEERGLNTYRRVSLEDAEVARDFLVETGPFWADVRDEWQSQLASSELVLVRDKVKGTRLHLRLFMNAEEMSAAKPRTRRAYISDTIGRYVEPLDRLP
jgi:hypothetical protein